jgi:hypothetical protein
MGKPIRYEELLIQLAAEFKRRGLDAQVKKLRTYYVNLKHRKKLSMESPIGESVWTEDAVIEMMCMLQLAPFDHVFERRSRCSCGADRRRTAYSVERLGDVGLWACSECKSVWLTHG